jgi:hypothetical protein
MTAIVAPRSAGTPVAERNALNALRWLPVAVILVAQAALTTRLFHIGIASGDEARYIYSGHQLIHELWHGGGSPYYENYLSGAPVMYPVLAAMADSVGGLAAVRLMSMAFMLLATTILYAVTNRLFGYWPGIFAAGLFAGLGLTQDLGAYATFDAMSLMLIAAAAYCAVRTGELERNPDRWLISVPLALLAANATKYVSVLFDPFVIGLAAFQVSGHGWRRPAQRFLALSVATGALLIVSALLAGAGYIRGILFTTLARTPGTQVVLGAFSTISGKVIIRESWMWLGAVLALGAVAVTIALLVHRDMRRAALLALMVVAGLVVTAEALHLHSDQSMQKHDDFGAWFTCIAAGYVLSYAHARAGRNWRRYSAILLASTVILLSGAYYSSRAVGTYEASHDRSYLTAFVALRPYMERPGRYLLGGITDDEWLYADRLGTPWYSYFDDVYIKYPLPGRGGDSHGQAIGPTCVTLKPHCMYLEGIAGYRTAIRAHWFTFISMIGEHEDSQDTAIEQAVEHTPGYVLLSTAGGAPTWIYAPAYHSMPSYRRGALA